MTSLWQENNSLRYAQRSNLCIIVFKYERARQAMNESFTIQIIVAITHVCIFNQYVRYEKCMFNFLYLSCLHKCNIDNLRLDTINSIILLSTQGPLGNLASSKRVKFKSTYIIVTCIKKRILLNVFCFAVIIFIIFWLLAARKRVHLNLSQPFNGLFPNIT